MSNKLHAIYKESIRRLESLYDSREASAIMDLYFEDALGFPRLMRLSEPNLELTTTVLNQITEALHQLENGIPVQYVIGHAYFMGHEFIVNEHVLIPRPETEELVRLIERRYGKNNSINILDVGSGSGCITISLDLGIGARTTTGWDISTEAVNLAKENAKKLNSRASFMHKNIFNDLPDRKLDILVSNPPYIPEKERQLMHKNVVENEPEVALFVPDDNPLIFYKRLAEIGSEHLQINGTIYLEIHENMATPVVDILKSQEFTEISIEHDIQGKDRIVSGVWSG